MQYKRVFAIGDIHGEYEKLKRLLKDISYNENTDFLIFVGDYIDFGQNSCKVLQFCVEQYNKESIVFLKGNHDQMMLDSFVTKEDQNHEIDKFVKHPFHGYWWINGGERTKHEVVQDKRLPEYLKFLNSLRLYHTMQIGKNKYLFCHAGIRPHVAFEKQDSFDLLWIREDFYEKYDDKKLVVVAGHTDVRRIEVGQTRPILRDNMILLDTGAGRKNGILSCVELLSRAIYQS